MVRRSAVMTECYVDWKKEFLRVHLESTYSLANLFLKVCLSHLKNIYCWTYYWVRVVLMVFKLCSSLCFLQQSILKQTYEQVFCFGLGWWGFGGVFSYSCFLTLSVPQLKIKNKLCIKWCMSESCDTFRNEQYLLLTRFLATEGSLRRMLPF